MIQDLEISNFKCFRSLYLPDLSQVNLIGGANNVGKTALLEALYLFHDRKQPDLFLKHFGWRGLEEVRTDLESVWGPYFADLDMERVIRMKIHRDGPEESAEYRFRRDFRPKPADGLQPPGIPGSVSTLEPRPQGGMEITYADSRGGRSVVHSYMDGNQPRLDSEDGILDCPLVGIVPARTRPPAEREASYFSQIREMKKQGDVETFLRIIDPRLSDLQVSVATSRPRIYCDIGLPRLVPIAFAGDGLTRLLSIILHMIVAGRGLVLLDEVENGIHYSVQEKFWKGIGDAAKNLGCQVVATTHSHECLMAAHAAFAGDLYEPEFRYIRLERVNGEIRPKTFNHETLGVALQTDLEVR